MKKHDEGYVLAYVTVVLLIFCLVATVILTGALRNLQNQQMANEQMIDQYAAEGEIEKVVAQLAAGLTFEVGERVGDTQVTCEAINKIGESNYAVTLSTQIPDNSVQVTCEIVLDGTCMIEKTGEEIISYEITELERYDYLSYQIGGDSQ